MATGTPEQDAITVDSSLPPATRENKVRLCFCWAISSYFLTNTFEPLCSRWMERPPVNTNNNNGREGSSR